MSTSWNDDGLLELKDLENQLSQFVAKSEIVEMLKIQLEEVEMLQSMFSNPGEFEIYDHSVIADINEFIEGKSSIQPHRIDFIIHLVIDDKKLEVCVNLPLEYPAEEPDIFVRSDSLSRTQQNLLNADLIKYICSLNKGEICIYPTVAWLQENGLSYFNINDTVVKSKRTPRSNANAKLDKQFSRFWIYSHHIYSKIKRKCIIDLSVEYNLTGFCLPGKPGIICVEGLETDCSDWWQRIRSMNWKKIICKKKEEEWVPSDRMLESFCKFTNFQEISFDSGKIKSRESHMDMGEFYKYLTNHDCSYVFRDYFGVEGKVSSAN